MANEKKLLSRLWDYWIENLDTAGKGYKRAILIIAICSSIAAVISNALNLKSNAGQWTARISPAFAILFTGSFLLWIPFRRHESQINKSGETLTSLVAAHTAERRQLSEEISRLEEERSKTSEPEKVIVQTMYKKLLELRETFHEYTGVNESQTRPARKQLFDEQSNLFERYLRPHKINLPPQLFKQIENIHEVLARSAIEFSIAMSQSTAGEYRTVPLGQLFNRYTEMSKDVPQLFESLAASFQDFLGVTTDNKKQLIVTAHLSLEHTNDLHGLLTVKVLNKADRIARIRKVAALLNPNNGFDAKDIESCYSELNISKLNKVTDIPKHDGICIWEQVLRGKINFLVHERNGTKYGKGYVELTSEEKLHFEFELLTDTQGVF